MKTFFKTLILLIFCISCENNKTIQSNFNYDIVPVPKEIIPNPNGKGLIFQNNIHFTIANPEISSLIKVFEKDIKNISSVELNFIQGKKENADLVLEIDDDLETEEYLIEINENIKMTGGSYNALVMAKSSLIQLMDFKNNSISFPLVNINLILSKVFSSPHKLKKASLSISSRYCSSTAVNIPPFLPPVKT